jgi:hypothetical protein
LSFISVKHNNVILQILPTNSVMHVVWKRVHWCVVVFDGNKAQLFKDTYTQQDAFRKDWRWCLLHFSTELKIYVLFGYVYIVIHWRKLNLASTYLGGCENNWVTEEVEIGFPPSRYIDRPDASCPWTLQPAWLKGTAILLVMFLFRL